jgi:hypothetical protein
MVRQQVPLRWCGQAKAFQAERDFYPGIPTSSEVTPTMSDVPTREKLDYPARRLVAGIAAAGATVAIGVLAAELLELLT